MPEFWSIPSKDEHKPRRRLMAENDMTGHEYPQPHILASPPGTQAPAHLINYTPDTNEVHGPGSMAPLDRLNYSLMAHDGMGAGADYSGPVSPGAPPGPGTEPGMDTLTGRYGQQASMRSNTFSPGQPPLSPKPYGVGPGPRIQASGPNERPFDQRGSLQGNASNFGAGQEGRQTRDKVTDFTGLDDDKPATSTSTNRTQRSSADAPPGTLTSGAQDFGTAGSPASRKDDAAGRASTGGPAPAGFRFHVVRDANNRPQYLWLINDADPSRNIAMGWYDPIGMVDPRTTIPAYQNFDDNTRKIFSGAVAGGKSSSDFVVEEVHNYDTGLTEKRIFDKTNPEDKGRVIGNVAPDKAKEPPLSTPGGGRVVGTGAGTIVYRTKPDGTEEVDQAATAEMRQAALDAEERKSEADILQAELDYDAAMGTATIFTTIEDADGQKYLLNSNTGSTMKLGPKDFSKNRVQLGNTLVFLDEKSGQVKDTYTAPKDMIVDEFNGVTYQYDPRNPSGTMKELFKDPFWQPTEENKLAKSKADLAKTLADLDKGVIDEMEARTRIEKDLFDLENIKPELLSSGSFYLAPGAKVRVDYNENFGRADKLIDTGPMDPRRRAAIDSMRAQLDKMGGDKKGAAEYLAMAEGLGKLGPAQETKPAEAAAAKPTEQAKPAEQPTAGTSSWQRADQEGGRTPAGNELAPEPGRTGTVSPDDPRYLGPRPTPEPAEEESVGEEITEEEPDPTQLSEPEPAPKAGWKPRPKPRAAAKPASTIVDFETPWHEQAYEAGIGGWKRANEEPDRTTPWYEQALRAGIGGWGAGQDDEASEYGNRIVEPPPETPGAFDWLPQLIGKTFKESQVQTGAPADIGKAVERAARDATNRTYPSIGPQGLGLIDPRFAPPEAKAEGLSSVLGRRRAPATPVAKVAEEASLWGPAPLQQYGAGADDDDTWWMEEEDRPRRYKPGQGPRQPRSNIDPKTGKPISRERMRKRPDDLEAEQSLRRELPPTADPVKRMMAEESEETPLKWDEDLRNFRDLYEAWKASAPPGHGVDIRQQRADEEARIGQMGSDELWRRDPKQAQYKAYEKARQAWLAGRGPDPGEPPEGWAEATRDFLYFDPVKEKLSEPEPGFNEEGVRDYTRDSPEFTRHHAGISEKYEDLVPAEEYLRHLEENRDPAELSPGRQRGQLRIEDSPEWRESERARRAERARRLQEQRAPSPSRPSEPPELNDPDALADLVRPETQGALERERPGWERPGDPEDFPESLRRLGYSQEDLDESNPYTQWMQGEKKPEPTTWEELARLAPKDRPPIREEEPEVEWMNPGGWPEGGLNTSTNILDLLPKGLDSGPQILDIGKGHAPAPKLPMGPNIFTPPVSLPGAHAPGPTPELPKWLSNLGPDAIRALKEKLGMGAGQGPGEMAPPGGMPPPPPGGAPPPGGPMPPVPPQDVAGIGHRFGQPMSQGEPLHSGVDLQATEGTPTVAPEDGIVEEVRDDPAGLGLTVIVRDKNGMQHKLGHLSSTDAYRGMVVAKGQNLARVGSSGNTTGSHLHWAVRDQAGQPTDPTPALGAMGGLPPVPGTEMMGPPGGSGSPPGMAGPPTGAPPGAPPPGPQGAQGMPPEGPAPGEIAKQLGMGQDSWWEPMLGAGHEGMGAGQGEGVIDITPDQQAEIDQENKRIDMEAENNRRDNETRRYIADKEHEARMKEIDQNWLIHQDDDRRQQEINAETTRHNQASEQIERDRIQADITIQQMRDANAIKLQQMEQGNAIYMQQGEQAFQDWQNQQKMRMDILGSALKNPWLQKLSGMTPGPGYQGQQVGGQNISNLVNQILQPYDPRAWGAQNAPSVAGLGGTTAGGPEGALQTPGGGMFQQQPQGGAQGGAAAGGQPQAYMQGGQVYQGNVPQGYNTQTGTGTPDYMQWRGWDPFQRAAYRTNIEALGPGAWEAEQSRIGDQFAQAGGTPEVTRMQAAASDAAGRAGMEMTGEMFGQTGEQFWQDQSKQWGQAKAPTVRQNLTGAQQTRY